MPDICLLPMIAETLGVSIDELFGINNAHTTKTTNDFPQVIHSEILSNIAAWFDETEVQNAYTKYTDKKYEGMACVIFTKDGAIFENKSIGVVFPKSPEDAIELLKDYEAAEFISLISDKSVLTTIHYLATTKQFATVASISNKCSLSEDVVRSALEKIKKYKFVNHQTINHEDEKIEVWRIQRTHALFFIYTILELAKHASKPNDSYFYYRGNDYWCY